MTDEPEPLHGRALEYVPLYPRHALSDLGSWLFEEGYPFTCDIVVRIRLAGQVEIVLTGKTSPVEAAYARLLKRLKAEP